MSERVRLGVIGAGAMGANHCRVARGIRGAELVGVHDVDRGRAEHVATQFDVRCFSERKALLDAVDAVVIAVPTSIHAPLAIEALESGRHVLIEKPIADTPDAAHAVVAAARAAHRVCAVGHVERHNATFSELMTVLGDERPIAVNIRRLNYFAPRITDADVTLDLLIHDVDLLLTLVGSEPTLVSATGLRVISDQLDHVDALFVFRDGAVGALTASRVTEDKIRRIEVIAPGRYVVADLLRRTLTIHQRAESRWETGGPDVKFRLESVTQQVQVPAIEPLQVELEDLVSAIRDGRSPRVTAEDGMRALLIVLDVQRQAEAVAPLKVRA